jgi:hypothetical protein
VGPLRATCVAAGLDAITADDAPRALRAAAEACGGTGLAGVVVDVAAVDALAEALCEELRALPGRLRRAAAAAADGPLPRLPARHAPRAARCDLQPVPLRLLLGCRIKRRLHRLRDKHALQCARCDFGRGVLELGAAAWARP